MQIDGEYHHQVGCDHGKFALGEVHDVGGAEDQHEAERYKRIDGADADTGKEQLQYEIHESARWERLAALLLIIAVAAAQNRGWNDQRNARGGAGSPASPRSGEAGKAVNRRSRYVCRRRWCPSRSARRYNH